MAEDGKKSLYLNVLGVIRRVINADPPRAEQTNTFNQSIQQGLNIQAPTAKRKSRLATNDIAIPAKRVFRGPKDTPQSVPLLRWEAKRLKIDLIAAKAQIAKLEARITQQQTLQKEMEIMFEKEKALLVEQHKRDEGALTNMKERLQVIRQTEQELKDNFNEAVQKHKNSKLKWDKEKVELDKQIAELKDKMLEFSVSCNGELAEIKKDMDQLLIAYEGAQSEVDMLKRELEKQKSRADQYTSLKNQLDKQNFEMQQVTNNLKELEYERDSYKDWKQQAETAQKRLTNMAKLEKEVVQLRATVKFLREAVRNKLLLEEQVHSLTNRLEALQPVQQELHEARVRVATLEARVEEWSSTARTHGVGSARALSAALDAALNSQVTAVINCEQAQSQLTQLTEEMASMKYERDKANAKLNDIQTTRENQISLIDRLQKRLMLIIRERDSYRQQLDCYEQELSVMLCGETGAGGAALLSARVEQLERALQGYRDVLATHDTPHHANSIEKLSAEVSSWRDKAEAARRDVTKLRAQRDRLQQHIEKLFGANTKARQQPEGEEAERKAREESERQARLKEYENKRRMAEEADKLRREKAVKERLARKRRVEAILARTKRKKTEEDKEPRGDNGNAHTDLLTLDTSTTQPPESQLPEESPAQQAPAAEVAGSSPANNGNHTADLL